MAFQRLNNAGTDFSVSGYNGNIDNLENMHLNTFGRGVVSGLVMSSAIADTVAVSDGSLISRSYVALTGIPSFGVTNNTSVYIWITEVGAIIPTATAVYPGSNAVCLGRAINTSHVMTFDFAQKDVGFISTGRGTWAFGQKALTVDGLNNRVGIGVASPQANLHIAAGISTLPAVIINAGSLVAALVPNAIEYDGTTLWLTLNDGVTRVPVNQTGVSVVDIHLGDVTATPTQYASKIIKLTGALTADQNLILPLNLGLSWIIINATTGAHTVTVKGLTGSGNTVTQGDVQTVYSDGTDFLATAAAVAI